MTLPNSPKVNLHNNNTLSLNQRLINPATSGSTTANPTPVLPLTNKDSQHIRQTPNSLGSLSSSTSILTVTSTGITDASSGPSSLPTSALTTTSNNNKGEMTDDGEPLYDSVASEDDYSYVEQMQKLRHQTEILADQKRQHQLEEVVSNWHALKPQNFVLFCPFFLHRWF